MLWLAIVFTQTNLSKKSTLLYLSNFAKIVFVKIAASMCPNVLYGGGGGRKHPRSMLWLVVAFKQTALLKNERNICLIVQNVFVKIAEHICPSVLYGGGHKHRRSMLWRQLPSRSARRVCNLQLPFA